MSKPTTQELIYRLEKLELLYEAQRDDMHKARVELEVLKDRVSDIEREEN